MLFKGGICSGMTRTLQRQLFLFSDQCAGELFEFTLARQHAMQIRIRRMKANAMSGKNMPLSRYQHGAGRQLPALAETGMAIGHHVYLLQPVVQDPGGGSILAADK